MANNVYISKKPIDTYIGAVIRENEPDILARGKYTGRAIDVALIVQRIHNYVIEDMKIYDEEIKKEDSEQTFFVSAIKISLKKK